VACSPGDPNAYGKRGKFLASSFRDAEFWGRPLDEPQRVAVSKPLIGDEELIERKLFGRRVSSEDITIGQRWKLDAKMKSAALRKGYDSIVLMAPRAFEGFQLTGKLPRSMELNVLKARKRPGGVRGREVKWKERADVSGTFGVRRRERRT